MFARSVLRNAEATSASLNKAEDKARRPHRPANPAPRLTRSRVQLRREIPETVAACQAQLDERLPQTLKAVAVGDLVERAAAALAAHDTQLPAKQDETRRVISRLYEQQERKAAQAAAAQQARELRKQAACVRRLRFHALLRRSGTRRRGKRRSRRWSSRHNHRQRTSASAAATVSHEASFVPTQTSPIAAQRTV